MTNIVQVTNIASTVTEDNIKTLFTFVGELRETIIYFDDAQQDETKVAYIVFESNNDAETALHLHNTLFHDRALIILPLADSCKGQIPDVSYAKMVRAPDKTVTGICSKSKNWPSDVLSMVVGRTGEQSIITIEPSFVKQGLPNYPKLPYSTEVSKIDEIRRTILITNLDTGTSPQQVLDFFQPVAEVKFIRMAGSEHDNAAYVEFSEQLSVAKAFGMMGTDLNGRAVMIQHSNVAINKPTANHRGNEDIGRKIRDSTSRSRSRSQRRRSHRRSRSRISKSKKGSRTRRSRSRRGSKSRRRSPSRTRRGSRTRRRSPSRSRRGGSRTRRSRSKPRKDRKRSISKPKERKRSISKTKEQKRSHVRRSTSRDNRKKSVSVDKKKDRSRSRHRRQKDSRLRHDSREKVKKDRKERNGSCDKSRKYVDDKKEDKKKPSSEGNKNNLIGKHVDIEKNCHNITEINNKINDPTYEVGNLISKDCETNGDISHTSVETNHCDLIQ